MRKHRPRAHRIHPPYDLFGEIPVYHYDIAAWLLAVPRIDPDSPRAAQYVRDWNVVAKIKAAKARGQFDSIVSLTTNPMPHWWQRFGWYR